MASLTRRGPLLLALATAAVVGYLPTHGLGLGLREKGEEAERDEMRHDEAASSPIPTTPCLSVRSAEE